MNRNIHMFRTGSLLHVLILIIVTPVIWITLPWNCNQCPTSVVSFSMPSSLIRPVRPTVPVGVFHPVHWRLTSEPLAERPKFRWESG
jgi:hypothetical protein